MRKLFKRPELLGVTSALVIGLLAVIPGTAIQSNPITNGSIRLQVIPEYPLGLLVLLVLMLFTFTIIRRKTR